MIRSFCFLAAFLLASTLLAAPAPQPKPFVSGWGKPVDPDRDCKIRRDKGALIFELPGSDHDYNPLRGQLNAPRLFREHEIEGDFVMQVRVRIDCRPSIQSTVADQHSFVSAGFLVILPDDAPLAFIRMEFGARRNGNGVEGYFDVRKWLQKNSQAEAEAEAAAVGVRNPLRKNRLSGKVLEKGWRGDPYMQLERKDGDLSISISSDGKTWKVLAIIGGTREKLKVGLAAYSTSSEPSKIQFDRFKLTVPRKKKR